MNKVIEKTETIREDDSFDNKDSAVSAINQIVLLILGIIEVLLLGRFVFRLTGANPASGIVDLVYAITDVLMAPFFLIFPTTNVEGASVEWPILVAMVFYAIVAWIIIKLISILDKSETAFS
jgi:hypothetical protein